MLTRHADCLGLIEKLLGAFFFMPQPTVNRRPEHKASSTNAIIPYCFPRLILIQ